ncbi:MAG TPA: ABC transporter permease [Bryobacteraceae bacterium]|nr:ABC transporter permease [Bryobacteraceae bacterium]
MLRWVRLWLARKREERDLSEELRAHLAIETRQRMEGGESAEEAERAARRAFGVTTKIQEDVRESWGWAGVERFTADVRLGLRTLRKTPVWTAVVAATLALGVGLSTAIFSVVYGVLLQPLPYPNADRLVALWPTSTKGGYARFSVSAALWLDWRQNATLLEDIALTRPIANFNLTGDGAPERLQGARTTYNAPLVLRVRPLLGRLFSEEEQHSDAKVAILSYAFWKRRFGGDSEVIGRKIQLNGEPFEVIGVMPPEYAYPSADFELWTPLFIPPNEFRRGMNYQYICVGRLKPAVSVEQAQAEFSAMMRRLSEEYPDSYRMGNEWVGALVEPLARSDASQVRKMLYVLLGAVGCLLLIGCMNLAVLLIARANSRAREMAVRVALGASSGRLRRQLLAETMPLSVASIGGGLLLSWWILQALLPYLPANTPRVGAIGLHGPVVAFAVGVSFVVVLLASLLPGRTAARSHPTGALQQSSRSVTGGGQARNLLVVAQITVTLILLFGALLFGRSFAALQAVNPGFASQGVLTMHLAVTRAKYRQDERVADYYRRILDGVKSIPGVTAAGMVNRLPLSGIAQTGGVEFEGRSDAFDSDWRSATPGYFQAIGIPLKQGRLFSDSDSAQSAAVGLIDERMAWRVFGSESPIGKRFRRYLPGFPQQDPWAEIVGVVGHILNDNLERDPRPQVYWPETQRTQDRAALVVRTVGHPEIYTQAVVDRIHKEDPDQPVYDVRSMEQWLNRTLETRTLLTGMVAIFGAASLLLASLGLYGVVSYTADLRLREFGIRMALGAGVGQVRGLVLRHAWKLAVWGSAIGLALSWPIGQALRSLLFGVTSADVISWVLAPAVLILVALLSGLGPARKAAKSDPAVTLRAE